MYQARRSPLVVQLSGLAQPDRLDRALRRASPQWGRHAVQRLISAGQVKVNGRTVWLASWQVHNHDLLEIAHPPDAKPSPYTQFEDDWLIADDGHILAVDKPAGLLSEPAHAPQVANLRDLACARFGDLRLVHRLDRDTSGVILLTRPGGINKQLTIAFRTGAVEKEYLAVVAAPNRLAPSGVITARLAPHPQRRDMMCVVERGGQHAITHYEIIAARNDRQLVRLYPQTGRTHQLRVHLAHLAAPILSDRLYGSADSAPRLMLHAVRITVTLAPNAIYTYTAAIPAAFTLAENDSYPTQHPSITR